MLKLTHLEQLANKIIIDKLATTKCNSSDMSGWFPFIASREPIGTLHDLQGQGKAIHPGGTSCIGERR